jgi:DNA-binding NarL/FixJ family response regulator
MSTALALGLTAREREVLELVAEGRTNQAIGHALALSPRTVAKHLEHSYRKLDVSCRTQAVLAVLSDRDARRT